MPTMLAYSRCACRTLLAAGDTFDALLASTQLVTAIPTAVEHRGTSFPEHPPHAVLNTLSDTVTHADGVEFVDSTASG
jgi:hypothetical protein